MRQAVKYGIAFLTGAIGGGITVAAFSRPSSGTASVATGLAFRARAYPATALQTMAMPITTGGTTYSITVTGTLSTSSGGLGGQTIDILWNGSQATTATTNSSGDYSATFSVNGSAGSKGTVTARFPGSTSGQYQYGSSQASATVELGYSGVPTTITVSAS